VLTLRPEGCRFLDVDEGNVLGAQAGGLRGGVAAHVARADDDHPSAGLGLSGLAGLEEIQGAHGPFLSRHGDQARFLGPHRDDHGVVLPFELQELLFRQGPFQGHLFDMIRHAPQFVFHHLVGDAAPGDGGGDLAPQPLPVLVNHRRMPLHP